METRGIEDTSQRWWPALRSTCASIPCQWTCYSHNPSSLFLHLWSLLFSLQKAPVSTYQEGSAPPLSLNMSVGMTDTHSSQWFLFRKNTSFIFFFRFPYWIYSFTNCIKYISPPFFSLVKIKTTVTKLEFHRPLDVPVFCCLLGWLEATEGKVQSLPLHTQRPIAQSEDLTGSAAEAVESSGRLPEGSGPPESGEISFKDLRTEVQAEGQKRRGVEGRHGCGGEKLEQGSDRSFSRAFGCSGPPGCPPSHGPALCCNLFWDQACGADSPFYPQDQPKPVKEQGEGGRLPLVYYQSCASA